MAGYRSKDDLASGMAELLNLLSTDRHPLSRMFLKLAEQSINAAAGTVNAGAPTQWTSNCHLEFFIYVHRRLYRAIFEKTAGIAEHDLNSVAANVNLSRWHPEARKVVFAGIPWRSFPFRSKPSYGTCKDRYNKATQSLKKSDTFHAVDNLIFLETIFQTWGHECRPFLESLPDPLNQLSLSPDEIYNVLSKQDGILLPPD